jgi:hypothetical protein
MTRKILYFTAGPIPTELELEAIDAIKAAIEVKFELGVRNALASNAYGAGVEAADYVAGSNPSGTYPDYVASVAATGTLTVVTNPAADETIAVAGTTFTFKASGATGDQINIGANVNATATAIAAAVNALALVNAAAVGAVVTVTAATAGTAGNALGLTANGAKVTRSAATLTGGAAATGYVEFDPENPPVV